MGTHQLTLEGLHLAQQASYIQGTKSTGTYHASIHRHSNTGHLHTTPLLGPRLRILRKVCRIGIVFLMWKLHFGACRFLASHVFEKYVGAQTSVRPTASVVGDKTETMVSLSAMAHAGQDALDNR